MFNGQYRKPEISQWLGMLIALPEDPGSFHNIHFGWLIIICNSSSRGTTPSSGLHGYLYSHAHCYTNTHACTELRIRK